MPVVLFCTLQGGEGGTVACRAARCSTAQHTQVQAQRCEDKEQVSKGHNASLLTIVMLHSKQPNSARTTSAPAF